MKRIVVLPVILITLLITIVSCHPHKTMAVKSTARDTATEAIWAQMIDDTNANFNQTVRAFDLFWANKTLPIRLDNEGKDLSKSEEENEEEEASETKSEYQQFTYDVKRYLNWKQRNQNLVKPDGRILTPHEIYMQWLKSQPHE